MVCSMMSQIFVQRFACKRWFERVALNCPWNPNVCTKRSSLFIGALPLPTQYIVEKSKEVG